MKACKGDVVASVLEVGADHVRWNPVVRRWSGIALVTAIVGSGVGTGAIAAAAGPLRLGSAAASRGPVAAAPAVTVRRIPWRSVGTVTGLSGPVVASTGPAPARADLPGTPPARTRSVARTIARHLAAGNTEVARTVIPYEIYRSTGCRVDFLSTTVDPSKKRAVKEEREARGARLERTRGALGRDAVAHAAEDTDDGMQLHVIVANQCPTRSGA
jgi:hypothetical protein